MRTGHNADLTADFSIRLAGFTLFAPSLWKPATLPRRDAGGVIRPGKPDRIVPLFARYLFVQFSLGDRDWRRLRSLDGVDYVFSSTPESPTPVPDSVIEAIRALCHGNGCIYPRNVDPHDLNAPPALDIGATVRFVSGPMIDLSGVCRMSGAKRVELLLEIMGRPVVMTVPRSAVEAV